MALKNCKECSKQISSDANPCPHCGKKNPHGTSAIVKIGGGFLSLIGGLIVFAAVIAPTKGPAGVVANAAMDDITAKVARDSVQQYEIAKRSGNAIDVCVQAGLVSAAFLQAKDEANYASWKAIEKADCKRAGMPQ
jgi:hypothetical protein